MPASAALPRGEARTATYRIESNDRADLSSILAQAGRFAAQASSASELAVGRNARATFQAPDLARLERARAFPGAGISNSTPASKSALATRAKAVADLGWIVSSTLVRSGEIIDCLTRSALPFL